MQVALRAAETTCELSVEDDGIGIKPEFLPHVFERFRQADSSSTRPHGGLGLGLAIVRHLVELHGGSVAVASEGEGKGSTFTVRLPAARGRRPADCPRRCDCPRSRSAPQLDRPGSAAWSRTTSDARELIRTVLEQLGAGVTTVASATEGAGHARRVAASTSCSATSRCRAWTATRSCARCASGRPAAADSPRRRPHRVCAAGRPRRRAQAGFQLHVSKPVQPAELAAVVSSLAGRKIEA